MTGSKFFRSQDGYTLVELIVALAIGASLMVAISSVVLTSWQAANTATERVEASAQIRNFEYFAYDDFAQSNVTSLGNGGCPPSPPCSIALATTTYTWDGSNLDRTLNSNSQSTIHTATNVTAFSWYVDTQSLTVVVSLTVTVSAYSESQTFRFYPRVNS